MRWPFPRPLTITRSSTSFRSRWSTTISTSAERISSKFLHWTIFQRVNEISQRRIMAVCNGWKKLLVRTLNRRKELSVASSKSEKYIRIIKLAGQLYCATRKETINQTFDFDYQNYSTRILMAKLHYVTLFNHRTKLKFVCEILPTSRIKYYSSLRLIDVFWGLIKKLLLKIKCPWLMDLFERPFIFKIQSNYQPSSGQLRKIKSEQTCFEIKQRPVTLIMQIRNCELLILHFHTIFCIALKKITFPIIKFKQRCQTHFQIPKNQISTMKIKKNAITCVLKG